MKISQLKEPVSHIIETSGSWSVTPHMFQSVAYPKCLAGNLRSSLRRTICLSRHTVRPVSQGRMLPADPSFSVASWTKQRSMVATTLSNNAAALKLIWSVLKTVSTSLLMDVMVSSRACVSISCVSISFVSASCVSITVACRVVYSLAVQTLMNRETLFRLIEDPL